MSTYKRLLEYISYFENDKLQCCRWESGFPVYDSQLSRFIKDVYKTDLLKGNYLDYLEERGIEDFSGAIPNADMELLRSILTYFVRQERFCDGLWAKAVEEKVFLKILHSLREIEA